jgi:NAD(P)H dehydrogenase (quinone)
VNCLLILAHPEADAWGAALRSAAVTELSGLGVSSRLHDLYAMRFQPALSDADFQAWARGEQPEAVRPLQADVTWADLLVLLYPTRWGGTPAMLKGYIDRVFAQGFAYGVRDGKMGAFLTGKRALLLATTTDPAELELAGEMAPVMGAATLAFCGVEILVQQDLVGGQAASEAERRAILAGVREQIRDAVAAGV